MSYYHYTNNPIKEWKNYIPQKGLQPKPQGLWLSYKNQWLNYCRQADACNFNTKNYYTYSVSGLNKLNICKITNYDELIEFTGPYRFKSQLGIKIDFLDMTHDGYYDAWDGIMVLNHKEIKQELKEKDEFDLFIYGLDIDSCCIWSNIDKLNIRLCERVQLYI